jgi:hypothetical protein
MRVKHKDDPIGFWTWRGFSLRTQPQLWDFRSWRHRKVRHAGDIGLPGFVLYGSAQYLSERCGRPLLEQGHGGYRPEVVAVRLQPRCVPWSHNSSVIVGGWERSCRAHP